MQEHDERILNLLRLKEELEKDLKKRGLLRERHTEERKHFNQPKIEIELGIDLPVEKIWTVYDLNHFAYGISDEIIQKSLQKKLQLVKDEAHRNVLLNLIKLLRREKMDSNGAGSIHLESLKVLSELYMGDGNVIKSTVKLLKNYPGQALAYLTAAEVFLAFGKFIESCKLFQTYLELTNDPYATLLLEAHQNGRINSSTFASCVSKDGYKSMLLIVSALIEAEDKLAKVVPVLEKRNFACAQYISARHRGKVEKLNPHCSRMVVLNESLKLVQGEAVNESLLEEIAARDPLARLVLVSLNLKRNFAKAFEHMKAFLTSVGEVWYTEIEPSDKPPLVRNILEFHRTPKNSRAIYDEEDLERFLRTLSLARDAWIFFKDPEYLRLYFGERHCKNTCFWEV